MSIDTATAFKVGDKVEGLYAAIVDYYKDKVAMIEHAKWYPGKIASIHPGEGSETHLFEIEYNDGDRQTAVPARFIRMKGAFDGSPSRSSSSNLATKGEFHVGSKIEGMYNGKWYAGKITDIQTKDDNKIYAIVYDDGDKETSVPSERLRHILPHKVGAFVECRYRGGRKVFPGRVTADHGDLTYNISYDDGEREARVAHYLIREINLLSIEFAIGDKVEANYRSSGKYFRGTIVDINSDSKLCDIQYDDDEEEFNIPQHFLREVAAEIPQQDGPILVNTDLEVGGHEHAFQPGDKVRIRYKGGSKFFPGTIANVTQEEGSQKRLYDVYYDDGDREYKVDGLLIKGHPSITGTKKDPRPKTAPASRSNGVNYGLKTQSELKNSTQMPKAPNRKVTKDKEKVLKYFLEQVDPLICNCVEYLLEIRPENVAREMRKHLKHIQRMAHKNKNAAGESQTADVNEVPPDVHVPTSEDNHPPVPETAAPEISSEASRDDEGTEHHHHHNHRKHKNKHHKHHHHDIVKAKGYELEPGAPMKIIKQVQKSYLDSMVTPVVTYLVKKIAFYQPTEVIDFICDELHAINTGEDVDVEKYRSCEVKDRPRSALVRPTSAKPSHHDHKRHGQDHHKRHHKHEKEHKKKHSPVESEVPPPTSGGKFAVGDAVEVNYRKSGNFFTGKIKHFKVEKGTYDIAYDDGDQEQNVIEENIKALGAKSEEIVPANEAPAAPIPKKPVAVTTVQIGLFGIAGAGKTSIINAMQADYDSKAKPTLGFRPTTMMLGETMKIKLFDLGGGKKIRDIWEQYYHDLHAAIFVVDASADEAAKKETAEVFSAFSKHEAVVNKPMLLFSNKQDIDGAMTKDAVLELLGLQGSESLKCYESASVKPSSVAQDEEFVDSRIEEGLEWLLTFVQSQFDQLDARVKAGMLIKEEEEKKKRLERERRVLKKKIASAFIDKIDADKLPEGVVGNPEDVFDTEEGCTFLSSEIGQEKLCDEAVECAELCGFQRLALQMIGALNAPISKKKTPMPWPEVKSLILGIREELGI